MLIECEIIVMLKYIIYIWITYVLKIAIKLLRASTATDTPDTGAGEDRGVVPGIAINY